MAASAGLPEINYPTRVDADHQGPKVTVTAALCLSTAGVLLGTRLLIRWPWRRLLGFDDFAAIIASVCTFIIDRRKECTDLLLSYLRWFNG